MWNLIARLGNLIAQSLQIQSEPEPEPETNLSELPENCISAILSFTTPHDICRLSTVSKAFRSAANSNTLWNKFLPLQSQQILSRAHTPVAFSSKRELYFRLCDSILIDGGTKRFWLERSTAKICCMLSARELSIVWGNDQRYWRWVSRDDSRFEALLAVCWLEVRGRIDCRLLSPGTEYRASFVLKCGQYPQGWNEWPVKFSITMPEGGEEMEWEQFMMEMQAERRRVNIGGWMEVAAGKFTVRAAEDNDDNASHIEFCMTQVEGGNWNGGLLIDGVKIEPNGIYL